MVNTETKTALTDFNWDECVNDNKVLKLRKTTKNLNRKQNDLLALYQGRHNVENRIVPGAIITGHIKSISKRDMIIDIDYKDDVIVEHKAIDFDIISEYKPGDEIDVLIKEVKEKPFFIKGSVVDLIKSKIPEKVTEMFNNNVEIEGIVNEIIPAGFMLTLELDKVKIPAFMPNTLADVNKISDPNLLLNQKLTVMFESLEQDKGIYVVSRKKYLKTLIPNKIKKLKFGNVYEGIITGTTPYGVFIQFEECLTGMIHNANMGEPYRDHLTDIKPGTLIDFYVKEITNSEKIILTQILRDSLWDTIKKDDVLSGEVILIKPFGALIKLDYETAGLISTNTLRAYNKSLNIGEKLDVKVVDIQKGDRKIVLTFPD
jgi:ribosomal protein S1